MVAKMNTPTVQKQFTIESDILYIDLRSRACANLDLDPSNAELGYRISGAEGPKALPSSFDNEDDHVKAMDRICKIISRSRTKEYGIEIVNLVRPCYQPSYAFYIDSTSRNRPLNLPRRVPSPGSERVKMMSLRLPNPVLTRQPLTNSGNSRPILVASLARATAMSCPVDSINVLTTRICHIGQSKM